MNIEESKIVYDWKYKFETLEKQKLYNRRFNTKIMKNNNNQ